MTNTSQDAGSAKARAGTVVRLGLYVSARDEDETVERVGRRSDVSVHAISWVLRNSDERLGRRLVLIVLADHADADGCNAYPSVSTIAREARMSDRQVIRALDELRQSGAIVADGRGPSGTLRYMIRMPGDNLSGVTNRGTEMSPEPSLAVHRG